MGPEVEASSSGAIGQTEAPGARSARGLKLVTDVATEVTAYACVPLPSKAPTSCGSPKNPRSGGANGFFQPLF